MIQFYTRIVFLAATVLLLTGCLIENIQKQKQADALEATLSSYSNAVRWGYFDHAYNFRKSEKGKYPTPPERLKEIRVTSYDVIHPPTMVEEDIAVQQVVIKYYHTESQRLKSLQDRQVWVYDSETQRWYLDSPMPEFLF